MLIEIYLFGILIWMLIGLTAIHVYKDDEPEEHNMLCDNKWTVIGMIIWMSVCWPVTLIAVLMGK